MARPFRWVVCAVALASCVSPEELRSETRRVRVMAFTPAPTPSLVVSRRKASRRYWGRQLIIGGGVTGARTGTVLAVAGGSDPAPSLI